MPGLTHIRLLVDDLARMTAFYRDRMGYKTVVDVPNTYVEFDTGAARLALYPTALMSGVMGTTVGARGDDVVLGLQVGDVDAEARRLSMLGVTLVRPPQDQPAWLLRVAHLRDPEGHLIELWAPLRRG